MRRKKSAAPPRVLAPLRNCKFCKGTGWVSEPTAPQRIREVNGQEQLVPKGAPPVQRCSCTIPERRDDVAPQPAPAALDQAQRAAGEKESD